MHNKNMETKYNVFAGRSGNYLGEFTIDEIEEKWEEWPLKFNHERKTVYILELF